MFSRWFRESKRLKILSGLKFGFDDLLKDISQWLIIGLLIGGVLGAFIPADFFEKMGPGLSRLMVLAVGLPMYICASATTPIAAVLIAKGMSPGVALILLTVGPATNISNIAVIQKYIGKKGVIINIVVIAVTSLAISFLVDYLYSYFSWALDFKLSQSHEHRTPLEHTYVAIFLTLLVRAFYLENIYPKFSKSES